MKKISAVTVLAIFLSLAIAGVAIGTRMSKTSASEVSNYSNPYIGEAPLPVGAWSLICAPSLLDDRGAADVYSVTSSKGDTVTKVAVRSHTNKPIIAIKLGWRLFYYSSPEKNLMSGESPLLGVALNENERRDVEFPLVSFAKISKSLLKEGRVDGDFKIEVSVISVLFGDSEEKTSRLGRRETSLASFSFSASGYSSKEASIKVTSYPSTITPLLECQDQECHFTGSCYECKALKGTGCSTNACASCTETQCNLGD